MKAENTPVQKAILGVLLILLSVAVYAVYYVIFRDVHHIFIYLIGDIAFVFIEVLLVILVIHHILEGLQEFLMGRRAFLVRLLENPNLLEHEYFTEVLWAVFHLAEELSHRKTVKDLPDTDYEHLSGDIKRVYRLLVREWLGYMEHLKGAYPYLFSLAVRTNPFDPNASPEVR